MPLQKCISLLMAQVAICRKNGNNGVIFKWYSTWFNNDSLDDDSLNSTYQSVVIIKYNKCCTKTHKLKKLKRTKHYIISRRNVLITLYPLMFFLIKCHQIHLIDFFTLWVKHFLQSQIFLWEPRHIWIICFIFGHWKYIIRLF